MNSRSILVQSYKPSTITSKYVIAATGFLDSLQGPFLLVQVAQSPGDR